MATAVHPVDDRYRHRYIIAVTVSLASVLELLDTSIVNVASVLALRSILYSQLNGTLLHLAEVEAQAGAAATLERTVAALREANGHRLGEIDRPTLLICGSEDHGAPPENTRQMHAAIKSSRSLAIEQAGHISNIEHPDIFNDAVVRFLGDVEQR